MLAKLGEVRHNLMTKLVKEKCIILRLNLPLPHSEHTSTVIMKTEDLNS